MTTITLTPSTEDRLRTVLLADAVVTAAVGLLALLGPVSWYGETPGWLVRTVGAVLLVTGAELGLLARLSGRSLRIAATVTAELAFAWALGTALVLAFVDLPATGVEVLAIVGVATLAFGVAETRLVRALR